MPAKSITDAFVRNVKLPRKDNKPPQTSYIDTLERGLALVLVVSYGGSRTFRVLTYRNGKPQSLKLGTYPAMTVKDARAKAREYWQDPKKFEAQAETGSFKEEAEEWFKHHVEASNLRSKQEIRRCLEKYVYPKWGTRRFLEIRRPQVTELLHGIVDKHGRSQADAVLAIIRGIMNWYAANRSEHYLSPIVAKMKQDKRKPKERARNRFLGNDKEVLKDKARGDGEILLVWKATDDLGTFGRLVKMLLLTGQRREKVRNMKWSDLVDGVWTIATEDREKGTAVEIKLPQLALDIIEAQPRVAKNSYVFAGRGKKAFNHFSEGKAELDEKLPNDMPHWIFHDLRRTARKLMTRARVRPDVAELAIGHSIEGIQAVYDDPVEYQPMIDHAFQCVANEIEKIINPPPANVVTMAPKRRK